jgi:uroporphyrin-III C-methyltransferase
MRGKVYLVGAGPGDPELLTVKAARLLQMADVVLHDALVPESVLDLARPHALLVDVGKRAGSKRITQAAINRMLVQFVASSATVVRLKGGDPLIFGRAAEEMAALRGAGVEFEIVPGITAAVASAAQAQIPLTNRESSSAVVFLTAQLKDGRMSTELARFAKTKATLAIYMPNGQYAAIAKEAMAAGLPAETPCLVVSNATRAGQELHWSELLSLDRLTVTVSPSLLIIGDVARPREEFLSIVLAGTQPEGFLDSYQGLAPLATKT